MRATPLNRIGILFLLLLSACSPQPIQTEQTLTPNELQFTNTPQEIMDDFTNTPDSDGDGRLNTTDLCPEEYAPDNLAGCNPLANPSMNSAALNSYTEIYALPMDPSGRISIAGNRLLMLTNYQESQINIYDLADGALLRNLPIPNLLNESPTLLDAGILLQNYDQQRWRLLDYSNGQEIFSADEEMELISPENNLLVSRADNIIILRAINNPQQIFARIPGWYAALDPIGDFLTVMDPKTCTYFHYHLTQKKAITTITFKDNPTACTQSPRFSADGHYLIYSDNMQTFFYPLVDDAQEKTFNGMPMAVVSDGLILLQDQQLVHLNINNGNTQLITTLKAENLRGLAVEPQEAWVAIYDNLPKQPGANSIRFFTLDNGKEILDVPADNLLSFNGQTLLWQFGKNQVTLLDSRSLEEVATIETAALQGLQIAPGGNYLLVSSDDQQVHVYHLQDETHE
jgi:WD40 repeat protein